MSAPNPCRPQEALRSGCGGAMRSGPSTNAEINRAIREAIWNAPPGVVELLPEELTNRAIREIFRRGGNR